jgi:hypothetical protein
MVSQVEEFVMPILEEEGPNDVLFQQDRAPPHFHREVTDFLNRMFPEEWISRGRPIKDAVYVPPLATTLPELAGRIRGAVITVTPDLLNNVWTEIEYRYICWATHCALIEHL